MSEEVFLTVVSLLPLLLVDLLDGPELLLELHPPVLEPDLDLALSQAERVGDLYAPPPGEIMVKMELLLQLQGLEPNDKHDEIFKINIRYLICIYTLCRSACHASSDTHWDLQ